MRLVGLLSWYDESPRLLYELVTSLGRTGVDHVVACDGAYGLYPGGEGTSGSEQHDAILDAAVQADIDVTLHVPSKPWAGNETEKRTALFALGHAVAQPYEDWLVVADADEVWSNNLRSTLEESQLDSFDVGQVTLYEGEQSKPRGIFPIRKLFRADPSGIKVSRAHYIYQTGDGRYLWAPHRPIEEEPAIQLHEVMVHHRPSERTPERLNGRARYYDYRVQAQIEANPL